MTSSTILPPQILDHHPVHLKYALRHDTTFRGEHPLDPQGSEAEVVGVHAMFRAAETPLTEAGVTHGELWWHGCELRHWTGTRAEFAAADLDVRTRALRVGPAYNSGRWGTHLGATLTVVTADEQFVFRSRTGKYAEAHLYDSLAAGTMHTADLTPTTDEYLWTLLRQVGFSDEDITEFHPTHLAMRGSDFGLWIGGWARTRLTAEQVREVAPFETVAVALDADIPVPLTEWGQVDLDAARLHMQGLMAFDADFLP